MRVIQPRTLTPAPHRAANLTPPHDTLPRRTDSASGISPLKNAE
jgi:hypothetical protein